MPASTDTRSPAVIRIFGRAGSPMAYAIRDFLHRSDVPFEWTQLTTDEDARAQAEVAHLHDPRLPVCIFSDGSRLEAPTIRQITEKLGWFLGASQSEYDLAIYGAGPAGLSAAVYASSDGLRTVLIERSAIGGQAGSSSKIENYLGFPKGISGADLAERAKEQACRFGTEILIAREGVRGELQPGKVIGHLSDGGKIISRATVCATGVDYAHLRLPRADEFTGAGLYYGAGASEASLTAGEHVFVVGGGNSAGQAALHFAAFASWVTVVVRGDSLSGSLSRYLVDRILATDNVEVLTCTEVTALDGDDKLGGIVLTDNATGQQRAICTQWLFVCIGAVPRTEWAPEIGVMRDEGGYILTGPDLLCNGRLPASWPLDRNPYYLESSVPGLFAIGDVRHGAVKRCASAVGEGAMVVAFVHRFLAEG
ncbi:FAD-dependent oxidoreductase [Paraburkholderia dipogonis]|uniref:FAD-dependent oxidoreductase n=2 Tax=Paraburkholderia dipogonis TaxID=1211383 RepID=A0A4Y8NB23_9BURK|nr:FAD-dependent oxidoreductase [Paraburkholderia dipogonis]